MSPWEFRFFLFFKVPLAYVAGLRLRTQTAEASCGAYRHSWINKNPFHSIYLAAQLMAAEICTGLLCRYHILQSHQRVSFLVVEQEASFLKKATGRIAFRCEGGQQVGDALARALETGEEIKVALSVTATDEVSRVRFT